MPFPHFDATLLALAEPWFIGPALGPKYANILRQAFTKRPDQKAIDDGLALGSYLVHSENNKRHRHALRGVLAANFLMKNQPLGVKDALLRQYKSSTTQALTSQFKNLFPAMIDVDQNRYFWLPELFDDPSDYPQFLKPANWTRNAVPKHMFFIHTVRHGADVLNDPAGILGRWTAISMSVLGHTKPICYTNHGVIMSVPANNVLTTSPTDQWFDNYAGTDRSTKAIGQSMPKHIAEKSVTLGGMLKPTEVMAKQDTPQAMDHFAGASITKHNEVVVCGVAGQPLPHGVTGALRLRGVFLQTKMDGTMPQIYMKSQGPSNLIEAAVKQCAKKFNVPLLYLPTNTL